MNSLQAIWLSVMIAINFFELFIEIDEHRVLSLALDSFNNAPVGRKTSIGFYKLNTDIVIVKNKVYFKCEIHLELQKKTINSTG